ncbi:MAG: hypothetical protein JXA78_12460 [Anaerolineales bacterium]|nr:hypothetical protein [Anaerolineales bacterium]
MNRKHKTNAAHIASPKGSPTHLLSSLLAFSLVVSLAATSGCKSQPEEELNQVVITSTFEGVIFTEEHAAQQGRIFGDSVQGYWTPSQADVIALETGLPAFLQVSPGFFQPQPPIWERLQNYKRQYLGIQENGKRVIYANFFCQAPAVDWKNQLVMVADGGDCYFQIKFEVDAHRFYDLQVNSEA